MNFLEVAVTLVYLALLLMIGYGIRSALTTPLTKRYFVPALALKLIGAVCVGLIYYLYYGGGDTVAYYDHGAQHIFDAFLESPALGLDLIFGENVRNGQNIEYTSKIWVYRDSPSYSVVRFAGFLNLFAFNTYGGTACLFGFFSFLFVWRLFKIITELRPELHKEFAIACFALPSVFFWGSGILKDTITFAFLCGLIASALEIYYFKKNILKNILIIGVSGFFIFNIKIYILIALVPAIGYLFLFGPITNLKNKALKLVATPVILVIFGSLSFLGMRSIGQTSARYKLEEVSATAEETARWIHYVSEQSGGASYSLGDYDFSATGVLKKTIPAIWVTLFRPHPWEVRNPVMLLSALESLFFLYLLFSLVKKLSWRNFRKIIKHDLLIPFSLIFTLLFSWAVGLTTYNFGSLVRYKIPMMPFFIIALYLLLHYSQQLKAQKTKRTTP